METSELTIKDLMIGDWVVINNIPRQITFIDDCINYKIIAKGKHPDGSRVSYVGKLSEEVKPIPLTPEILEKNGFIKESIDCFGNPLQYCILVDELWIDIMGENYFEGKLEYIHQLQHALRLCGITHEIII